jgi:hypothetical protein
MASSISKQLKGTDPWYVSPFTPGALGINDSGEPFCSIDGDTPSSLGVNDHAAPQTPSAVPSQVSAKSGQDFTKECEDCIPNPYWPKGAASGITIGYGHDIGGLTMQQAVDEFTKAGVTPELAKALGAGAGKIGAIAENWLDTQVDYGGKKLNYEDLKISQTAIDNLFETDYQFYGSDVCRICDKADVVLKYGTTNWNALNSAIKAITIDLRFRGDYQGSSRQYIQSSIVLNDPTLFATQLQAYLDANRSKFDAGIVARFNKRINYVWLYGNTNTQI